MAGPRVAAALTGIYRRDQKVWDACARTYERQIVGGHPDVTAYEQFEEELLDRVIHYLAAEQDLDLRLFDIGCGSARLHCCFGTRMADDKQLPAADAGRLHEYRERYPGSGFDALLAGRLKLVDGLDFSHEMLELAAEKLTSTGLESMLGNRLRLVQGSAFELEPLPEAPLPVAVSVCNSIGVMQGPAGASALFASMRRAIESAGGIAIISGYRKAAVASFALGNYETTMDVCGQPRWLEPDTYARSGFTQLPWSYKRAHSNESRVMVDVAGPDGALVERGFELRRNPAAVSRAIETGHIETYTDYESRWYSFEQFDGWMAEHWAGLNAYHLAGRQLDALRGEPAQLAILDPQGLLGSLIERWGC